MDATELRIGNLVLDTGEDGGVIKIEQIREMTDSKIGNMSISFYGLKGGYCTTSLEESQNELEEDKIIQPILLTEEWLVKFGFEKKKQAGRLYDYYYIKNGLYYSNMDFHQWVYKNKSLEDVALKHVHQLQNLYHALTNEELTAV